MTRFVSTFALMILSAVVMVGCEKAEDATDKAVDAAKSAAGSAEATGQQMAEKAQEAAASLTAEAQKLLDQATAYVKENKFELAEPVIAKLEAMKAQLPAEWATKVEQARSMFDSAKKAMQALPAGLPGAAPAPAATN